MIKYLAVIIQLLTASILVSFAQDISVKLSTPAEVKAGEEFLVSLAISKGSLDGFSRFSQNLPYGLSASRVSTANADFAFVDQRVRLIWLKLPAEKEITVTYKVKVDQRLKGTFTLQGDFSFVKGNERKNVSAGGIDNISIIPDPNLAENQVIDINEFEKVYLAELEAEKGAARLECIRRPPVQVNPREIVVELLVSKGNMKSLARIEEYIPEGFRASEMDSKNGVFSFQDQTVKISWADLPPEPEFTVRYRIFPERGNTIDDLRLSGTFSYIVENQVKTFGIAERLADIAILNKGLNNEMALPDSVESASRISNDRTGRDRMPFARNLTSGATDSWILQPENGIYFRIQVAAGRRTVNISDYFGRFSYIEYVKLEFHDGWFKYSVGSFTDYEKAKEFLDGVLKETPFGDAFIVAYNNGRRITVQEALDITGQN